MKIINPIEAAAADFARHTKGGGGWALGLEVAACVQAGNGQGRRQPRSNRTEVAKVSATEFATKAGTGKNRVMRYLEAWNRAAEAGIVPASGELVPTEWNDPDCLPEGYDWGEFYEAPAHNQGSRPKADPLDAVRELIQRDGPAAVAEAMVKASPVAAAIVESQVRTDRIRDYPAPFDTPPQPYPGADKATRWMDLTPTIARLHSAILDLSDFQRENADVIANYTDELQHEHDLLGAVIALARGISDDDLVKLLDGAR